MFHRQNRRQGNHDLLRHLQILLLFYLPHRFDQTDSVAAGAGAGADADAADACTVSVAPVPAVVV